MDNTACSCIWVDPGDLVEMISSTSPTARKEHECGECRGVIKPGEDYERVFYRFEKEVSVHKTCEVCVEIREHFFCKGYCYGMIYENLNEHIWNLCGKIGSECLLGLSPRARDVLFDLIESYWAETDEDEECEEYTG